MSWRSVLQARWQAVSRREQRLLLLGLGLVALALLWWLALAPALAVLKNADAQHRALEQQWQHMQRLQAQAKALQALPTLDAQESRRALEATLKPLGSAAQLSAQVDRMLITVKGLEAAALAQWLASVRQNAHLLPTEAHLKRASTTGLWDGTLVFTLPPQ
jgi:general secretion pathway protein M